MNVKLNLKICLYHISKLDSILIKLDMHIFTSVLILKIKNCHKLGP